MTKQDSETKKNYANTHPSKSINGEDIKISDIPSINKKKGGKTAKSLQELKGDKIKVHPILPEKNKTLEADGLLATCIQHEMDHLEGILFIDYLSKLKKTMIVKKLSKRKNPPDRIIV